MTVCPQQHYSMQHYASFAQDYRGTKYRGVSKNGRCNWQILAMTDRDKVYIGTVDNILKAGILYDIVSIQTKGLSARTNFNHTKSELLAIL